MKTLLIAITLFSSGCTAAITTNDYKYTAILSFLFCILSFVTVARQRNPIDKLTIFLGACLLIGCHDVQNGDIEYMRHEINDAWCEALVDCGAMSCNVPGDSMSDTQVFDCYDYINAIYCNKYVDENGNNINEFVSPEQCQLQAHNW